LPNNLPNSLFRLHCQYNQIKELPNILPTSLFYLHCENNEYMHVSDRYAKKYDLNATPNYNKKAIMIQNKWKSYKIRNIIVNLIKINNNILCDSFKNYGDLNVINLIIQFIYS